jgi:hypothetical protein
MSVEPVATRVLKFWSSSVLALKPTESPQLVEVTLEKNPRKLPIRNCVLKIEETGMREYFGR